MSDSPIDSHWRRDQATPGRCDPAEPWAGRPANDVCLVGPRGPRGWSRGKGSGCVRCAVPRSRAPAAITREPRRSLGPLPREWEREAAATRWWFWWLVAMFDVCLVW